MKKLVDKLRGTALTAIDGFVQGAQEWFEEAFQEELHKFCDQHQLRYDDWTMKFYDRQGFNVSAANTELWEECYLIHQLLRVQLSEDEDDRLGSLLSSYCPWETK